MRKKIAPNATSATLRSFSRVLSFMIEFPTWEGYDKKLLL